MDARKSTTVLALLVVIVVNYVDCSALCGIKNTSAPDQLSTSAGNNSASVVDQTTPIEENYTEEYATDEPVVAEEGERKFWLAQRDQFFNRTSFNLTKETSDLVGEEFGNRSYHLPFWFDYEMFKNVTDRSFPDASIAAKRHHIYIDNCVYVLKHNALRRLRRPNNFSSIDHLEDWTQWENDSEEWNEIDFNLTSAEQSESPVAKALRLVQEGLEDCTTNRDKNFCILLLVDLDERFGPPMDLSYPFEDGSKSAEDRVASERAALELVDRLLPNYWLDRRDQFFKNTSFSLSESTNNLLGQSSYAHRTYHLPYWFDYEFFKRMFIRETGTAQLELKLHHRYIDTCLLIWNETVDARLAHKPEVLTLGSRADYGLNLPRCRNDDSQLDCELTEEEVREKPVEKALRKVQNELDSSTDKRRTILLLAELEEKFGIPRASELRYPWEPEKTEKEIEGENKERNQAVAALLKALE